MKCRNRSQACRNHHICVAGISNCFVLILSALVLIFEDSISVLLLLSEIILQGVWKGSPIHVEAIVLKAVGDFKVWLSKINQRTT